jgi:hypothetical protein
MEKILARIEDVVEKQIKEFETNPIKMGLKFIIFAMLLKWAWKKFKED